MPLPRVPPPSTTFVGRSAELSRLEQGLARVPVALIYGAGGVGKSTLASALAARWKGPVAYHKAGLNEALATVADDVRRQLAQGPVPEAMDDDERLDDLYDRLETQRALLLLDDANRLSAPAREGLIERVGARLRHGRLIATARELLRSGRDGLDFMELRLAGLDEEGARTLWASLDELYGPSGGFEAAWQRSRGTPLLLRRAHAGELGDEEDPLAATTRSLSADERLVAGALAMADIRLPTAILLGLPPGEQTRKVLRGLVTRMVVEVDGAGTCALHDLFRDAILRELTEAERRTLHGELARLLRGAELDPVVRVRQVCRHLAALGQHDDAGDYLLEQSTELVRHGAAGELLRGFDAIPPEHRSPIVQIARARTLARMMDLGRVYDELSRLLQAGLEPRLELALSFGQVATLVGKLDAAVAPLREVLAGTEPGPLRMRALMAYALLRTQQGHGDEARALLLEEEARSADPVFAGSLAGYRAFTLWLDERAAEADEPLQRAKSILWRTTSFQIRVAGPAAFAGIRARQGLFEEAEALLASAEGALDRRDDPLLRVHTRVIRATYLYERGDRLEALDAHRALVPAVEAGQYVTFALWCQIWIARLMLEMGQREQAYRLLDELRRRTAERGLVALERMVERSRGFDPLARLQEPPGPLPQGKRGPRARARALEALRAGAAGEATRARALLEANAEDARGPGYGLDRAIGHLALATLERLQGNTAAADQAADRATREAVNEAVDAELLSALLAAVGRLRTVTNERTQLLPDAPEDLSRYEVVLDGRTHELRVKDRTLPLKSRPVLRRLLYAMASRPNDAFTKEELAKAIWSGAYSRFVHDNALKVNIKNLRTLLQGTPLAVQLEDVGYSLSVPKGFVFIDVLEP